MSNVKNINNMTREELDELLDGAGLSPIDVVDFNSTIIGNDINDRFDSIEKNFGALVYSDYLKGDKGDSIKCFNAVVKSGSTDLCVKDTRVFYKNNQGEFILLTSGKLFELMTKAFDSYNTYNMELNEGGENVMLLCEYVKVENEYKYILISSLPFIYLDPAFSDEDNLEKSVKAGLINKSCILLFHDNQFKKYDNIPSLYWDEEIKYADDNGNEITGDFCWKINGFDTGIRARGPRGLKGHNGDCYILKISLASDRSMVRGTTNQYNISQIFTVNGEGYGWQDYNEDLDNFRDGNSCICIMEQEQGDAHSICFGILGKCNEKWIVYADPMANIINLGGFGLRDALLDIGKGSVGGNRGLFIPYKKTDDINSGQGGHMMWSAEQNNDNSLHIGPYENVLKGDSSVNKIDTNTPGADKLNIHYNSIVLSSTNETETVSINMGSGVEALFTPTSITLSVKSN